MWVRVLNFRRAINIFDYLKIPDLKYAVICSSVPTSMRAPVEMMR